MNLSTPEQARALLDQFRSASEAQQLEWIAELVNDNHRLHQRVAAAREKALQHINRKTQLKHELIQARFELDQLRRHLREAGRQLEEWGAYAPRKDQIRQDLHGNVVRLFELAAEAPQAGVA